MIKNSLQRSAVIFTILSLFTLLVMSCKKDKETTPAQTNNSTDTKTYKEQISGKWTVGDGSGRIATNTSGYVSFEFTKSGSYIIGKSDATYLTGFYTLDSANSQITLGTFGVVTITKVESTVMNFKLRLTGTSTDIIIFGNKTGTTVSGSGTSKTDSLCQTWEMVTVYHNGVENTAVANAIVAGNAKATVVLTSDGTFLTIQETTGTSTIYNNGQWKWYDSNQASICTGREEIVQLLAL